MLTRKLFILSGILSLCINYVLAQVTLPAVYSDTTRVNYVRTWGATAPETDPNTLITRPLQDVKQTTAYFDGLGRPLQTVAKQASYPTGGSAADMVSPVVYDGYGREKYKYLPFAANTTGGNASVGDGAFKLNPFQEQAAFMQQQYGAQGETYYYGQTDFEASPLNRVEKAYAPGNSWVGSTRGVSTKYRVNTVTDSVKIWKVTDVSNDWGTYSMTGDYGAGTLFKNVTTDEQDHQVIEFKDKSGKVILKKVQLTATADDGSGSGYTGWLCTYYVYDNLNNLRLVIQPKGVELLSANSWNIYALSNAILDEQCFRYEYDQRNRMIRKKVPGAGEVWMVYDARDRLVMSQDANMRNNHQWLYTQYDDLNRPVATGLLTDNTNYNNLAYHLSAAYSSTAYPNLSNYTTEDLTYTFYDDYSWRSQYGNPLSATYNTSYDSYLLSASNTSFPYAQANTQSSLTKGLVTGTRTKVLGTSSYLYTVNIYDSKGRVIQVLATNMTGGEDITTTQYSWVGQPLVVVQKTQNAATSATETITISKMTYDDLGRLLTAKKTVSGTLNGISASKPEETIVQNEYDALGQLTKKSLGNKPGTSSALAKLDYDYNIRGWLLSINKDYITASSNADQYFGMELGYDKNGSLGTFTPQYNGNIGGTIWKSEGDQQKRKYNFTYDAVNRLTGAGFTQYVSGSGTSAVFNTSAGLDFSVNNLSYDANGNILSMKQRGWKLGGSATIDSLQYTYESHSNKLQNVIDGVNEPNTKLGDFRSSSTYMAALGTKTTAAEDYVYDGNGNLVRDRNKDIGDGSTNGISYNYLNLPDTITVINKGTIIYTYDAAGNKLKKLVQETGHPDKTTLYLDGAVYENDTLQFIGHEEGRIRWAKHTYTTGDTAYAFDYDYFLKDQLGNVRMVLTEQRDTASYLASMEASLRSKEEQLFYNIPESSYPTALVPGGYPTDPNNPVSTNDSLARVNGNGQKIGPAIVLKVMSGDVVDIGVKYFYRSNGSSGGNSSPLNDILTSLADGIVSVAGESKGTLSQLANTGSSPLIGPLNTFLNANNPNVTGKPKAYLNWILLDEQFNYVSSSSGAQPVGSADALQALGITGLDISKNGYLYIYVSNETQNWDVFFDNLSINHYTGTILEETHYYPFGLTMAGISSRAFGRLENKYKYNGKELQHSEFSDGAGLEMYDFGARLQDPQLGRWWTVDPKADQMRRFSPYNYAYDNPLRFIDPDGMSPDDWVQNKKTRDVYWDPNVHSAADVKDPNLTYVPTGTVYDAEDGSTVQLDEGGAWHTLDSKSTDAKPSTTESTGEKEPGQKGQEKQESDKTSSHEGLQKGLEAASTTIDALDNTARLSLEKGFEAANKISPAAAFEEGALAVKTGGRVLGAAAIGLTVVEGLTDSKGWQTKHTIDAAVGVASFVPVVGEFIAVGWFVGNLVSLGVNGKSLSENIQDAIEK